MQSPGFKPRPPQKKSRFKFRIAQTKIMFLFITEVYLPLTITVLHTPHKSTEIEHSIQPNPPTLLVGLFLICYILAPTHPHVVSCIDITPLLMD